MKPLCLNLKVPSSIFELQVSKYQDDWHFFRDLRQLRMVNSSVQMNGFPDNFRLLDIVGSLGEQYIAYRGSLTTPPCSPTSWLVSSRIRKVSRRDVIHSNILFLCRFLTILYFRCEIFEKSSDWRDIYPQISGSCSHVTNFSAQYFNLCISGRFKPLKWTLCSDILKTLNVEI